MATDLPLLYVRVRPQEDAAAAEYRSFLTATRLKEVDLDHLDLVRNPLPDDAFDRYSGFLIGGSPFNASDPWEKKSAVQRRVEAEMAALVDEVVARDAPFLGACYGVGTLGTHLGAPIDGTYAEPISVVDVALTDAGRADPLLSGMPATFPAFVGHKEAISALPAAATLLASSATCPVQMFRVGENVYATQFHPELDLDGIVTRIHAYASFGYFRPDELEFTLAAVRRAPVTATGRILRAFAERYAR